VRRRTATVDTPSRPQPPHFGTRFARNCSHRSATPDARTLFRQHFNVKLLIRIASALLAIVALLIAGAVVINWAPDRSVSELTARWAPPLSTFLEVEGMSVHLRDEGRRDDPAPIVLLHGTSASLHTWDGWVAALAPQRRVIRFDLPGFGLTGPPPDGDYRIERYVAFVTAVLDALDVDRCVLAGNSFGGWVAWETARALGTGRVEALVLVDASGYPPASTSVPIGFRLAKVPVLNHVLEWTLPRGVIESSLRNTYGDPSRVTPELVERYYELTLREGNRAALAQRFAQAPQGIHAALIPEVGVPTLILWGDRDRLIPPAHGERFQREIGGSRLVVFPGLGHVPHEEDPVATVAAVKAFLVSPREPAAR
jgi:pimeloyl-ACP methyl ester carboxylesterase